MIPAANPSTPPAIAQRNDAIVRRALRRFRQVFCRHTDRVIFAGRRIYVQCDSCARERPALTLDLPGPRRRA